MPDTDYGYALKMGRKRYQDALARGEYPYLPVLDNILANTDIVATVNLGVMDIPMASSSNESPAITGVQETVFRRPIMPQSKAR